VGSGTLNVLQSAELQVGGSAQLLVTGGSLNAVKTSLTLPTTAVSSGTLNAASLTARVGHLTVSGSGNVRTDRELHCDQLLLQGGFVTTTSVFNLTGAANSCFTGGEVRGPGTRGRFEVNGVLAVSSATAKTLRDCAVVFKPGATMQWMSGNVSLHMQAELRVEAGALLAFNGTAPASLTDASNSVVRPSLVL
jgi:hypothetical protein